jgi:hypothetical protein
MQDDDDEAAQLKAEALRLLEEEQRAWKCSWRHTEGKKQADAAAEDAWWKCSWRHGEGKEQADAATVAEDLNLWKWKSSRRRDTAASSSSAAHHHEAGLKPQTRNPKS